MLTEAAGHGFVAFFIFFITGLCARENPRNSISITDEYYGACPSKAW
jgi:hypothetical protein